MSILDFTKKRVHKKDTGKKTVKKKEKVANEPIEAKKGKNNRPIKKGGAKLNLQPLITEKSVRLQEEGVVVFRVSEKTTKKQVEEAVKNKYKTEPLSIRTMRMSPKTRRRGNTYGRTSGWKKVYVKVKDIHKIVSGP